MNPWGVYVHIPYCRSLCPYCDFNSHVDPAAPWPALQQALLAEFACRVDAFAPGPVCSVFFGGGTPSLAPPDLVAAVLEAVRTRVGLTPRAEITLEANPGSVTVESLQAFRQAGINRISLGWQSTHDSLLRVLGRGHSAADSQAAYDAARQAGFDNVSIDLIFAVPGQTLGHLQADLTVITALQPEHVSLYALTYKEGTPFYRRRGAGRLQPVEEDLECLMMEHIKSVLTQHGYEHYEVSNYARRRRRAVHNSLYWQGHGYLGIGPGAHSFHHVDWQRGARWESCRQPRDYIALWEQPHAQGLPAPSGDGTVGWCESLTARQLFTERMLCGLRHIDGVNLDDPLCRAHAKLLREGVRQALERQWARLRGNVLQPTPAGLQHADALAELFF